jgi:hypothetical protein
VATRANPGVGTFSGRLAAAEAASLVQRLLALDDLWTAELATAGQEGPLSEADLAVFDELVGQMREGLAEIGDHAYEVRSMLDELPDEAIAQALEKIAELPTAPAELQSLSTALPDYAPRGAAIAGCDFIRETAGAESNDLGEKLAALHQGEVPSGDFRLPFRCAALLMLVGAGAAATIGLGGAPAFVVLSAGSQVGLGALGWMSSKCPGVLPDIDFGRR